MGTAVDGLVMDGLVVGAGLSGLIAARRLQHQGLRVRVLEARTRIGGRMLSRTLSDGSVVDLGGQWDGTTHHRFAALLSALGISRYPSHYAGDGIWCWRGERVQAPLAAHFADSLLFFESDALRLDAEALLQRTAMGGMTKVLARYARPFWREQGLNGLGHRRSALAGAHRRQRAAGAEGGPGYFEGAIEAGELDASGASALLTA